MRSTPKRTAAGPQSEPFYSGVLTAAEQTVLEAARQVEGIDEEIALLRVKLRRLQAEQPEDVDQLLKGVRLVVQAVAVRYRIGGAAKDDLYQNVLGVLEGLGAALMPVGDAEDGDGR